MEYYVNGAFTEEVPTVSDISYDVRITRPADTKYEKYNVIVEDGFIIREKTVARIGNKIYYTLAQAIEDYKSGETIIMIADTKELEFYLWYQLYDKKTGEEIKDYRDSNKASLEIGEEYIAKIYMRTNSNNNITLRSFECTSLYDADKLTILPIASVENKYTTIDMETPGEIKFTMSTNSYDDSNNIQNGTVLATLNVKIEEDGLKPGEDLELGFGSVEDGYTCHISTLDSIHNIRVKDKMNYIGKVREENDGVRILDYMYAPKGYALAIIAMSHGKNETVAWDNKQLYYTTNENYIAQSTNHRDDGVYLTFVPVKSNYDEAVVRSEIETQLDIVEGKDYTLSSEDYSGDINGDGRVGANDASLVYQMLRQGGGIWGYEETGGRNPQKNIGDFGRIISDANYDGKLYGTIEDVMEIINLYYYK